jgi:chemotaxis protein methyltransferase WspC
VPSLAAAFPGPLRILSAPCSTGQEPYSLAATLLDAGLPATRFTLDALDISENALRVARRGVYAESALRGLGERDRLALAHFHDDRWIIRDELKDRIHFLHRNLAAQDPLAGEKYHLILCRNLFIYLHAEARATLAATLADALHPGGRLVIGTADHVPELNAVFAPLQPASAFALIPLRDKPQPGRHKPVSGLLESAIPPHNTAPQPSLHDADLHHASAEELHRRALESQHVGNVRLAERRCRQALYVDPSYLPAMELLDTLWHSTASMRMRAALSARIHRMRRLETHSE